MGKPDGLGICLNCRLGFTSHLGHQWARKVWAFKAPKFVKIGPTSPGNRSLSAIAFAEVPWADSLGNRSLLVASNRGALKQNVESRVLRVQREVSQEGGANDSLFTFLITQALWALGLRVKAVVEASLWPQGSL